ncbi:MAG: EAL domain-containing protein [Leptolyngbyaceae cyanobacterium bins.59]|nr:EAL domain-containing protein [Leptolyngbyaceae cyanobacterium bins.59]
MNWQCRKLGWRALPGGIAALTIAILLKLGALYPLEQIGYQVLFRLRGSIPWDERVVVIAIDEASLRELGRFPWNRQRYTQLIQQLTRAEPSVIVLDLLFPEQTTEDDALAEAIETQGQVVLARAWDSIGSPLLPTPILRQSALTEGHILKHEDSDGIVRKVNLKLREVPTLGLAAANVYSLVQAPVNLPTIHQPFWVNWPGPVSRATQYSFSQVLKGEVPNSVFQHKIVLVGVTASSLDPLTTPFDRSPPASGVFLHAAIINNLLQGNQLRVLYPGWSPFILLIGGPILSALLSRRRVGFQVIVWMGLSLGWVGVGFVLFNGGYWVPIAMPLLLLTATGGMVALQELFRINALLHFNAYHDSLTGLPNRAFFLMRLQQMIRQAQQAPRLKFAVLFLDIDRFKVVNDSLGHTLGDELLVKIARRLQSCLEPQDTVARLGGDEFVILLEGLKTEEEALQVADRIHQNLTQPIDVGGYEVFTATSIGIAIGTPDYQYPEDVLRDSDTAMYRAKAMGKGRSEVFHRTMHTRAVALLKLETDLRRAVDRQEFQVYYQPIVAFETGAITGFEALVRWPHAERGLVLPAEFILIAEETGLITALGEWMLWESCRQLKRWQQQFPAYRHLTMNVNLSGVQLAKGELLHCIDQILEETDLASRSLKLEITESAIMLNPEMALSLLKQLQTRQIDLCIDDFGIGYSSLGRLHRLPIRTLKIDRSFVSRIDTDREGWEIVWAITTLAQNLGLEVVAEGVESLAQVEQLQSLYCQYGQGYLFSPPVASQEAEKFLAGIPPWLAPDGVLAGFSPETNSPPPTPKRRE